MDENFLNKPAKRTDNTYKEYLESLIAAYNANGKKTVLMVCDTYYPVYDGVVNVLDNYARELCGEMNVLVLIPTLGGKVHLRGYPALGVTSLYSKRINYQIPLPAFDRRCARLLKKLRIDLIHCHSPFFCGRYALKLHRRRGIPMITTFHSQYKRDFNRYVGEGALSKFLLRFVMKVFNGSDEVWTMHTASRDTLFSYGYEGKVRLVPNGTSFVASEDYAEERRLAREHYGLGDKPLFIFVGRLVEQKNLLFLAGVLGELKRRGLEFTMMFVGDGPDKGRLERKLKEEDVLEDTVFTGSVKDAAELCSIYAAADLFLFPSLYDVSSIVQIEAASRHTPAVFAEGSVTSCTAKHGVNGFIFPCETNEYVDGVISAVADRKRLAEIGDNAYRDLFVTWDSVVHTAKKYYEEIIAEHAVQGGKK